MPKGKMISPQELFDAGKNFMLNGKDPVGIEDWIQMIRFFTVNIADGVEESACQTMRWMFDIPLSEESVTNICFLAQIEKKGLIKNDQKVEWKKASSLPAM